MLTRFSIHHIHFRCLALTMAALSICTASVPAFAADQTADTSIAHQAPETSAAHGDDVRPATEGFYPIWENTGFVERHREMYLGTNGAHYGILDVAHIGVQPINFMYRSPNAYVKASLFEKGNWHVAGQVGAYYLMNEASRSFFSPMYSSRLDNPDFSVYLVPVTLTATLRVSDWLDFHQTATALEVYSSSGVLDNQVYPGYSAVAELKARSRHSVLLHAGEVGFWKHDFSVLGTSYRYHNTWMEFRIGYFYRMRSEGMQSAPMIGFGLVI
jgi:hypothetical protein